MSSHGAGLLQRQRAARERRPYRVARAVALSRAYTAVQVGRVYGVSGDVVRQWRCRARVDERFARMVQQAGERLAAELEQAAFELVTRGRALIPAAESAGECFRALGVVVDKTLLLRGQATSISELRAELSPEARQARVVEILEAARLRLEAGASAPAEPEGGWAGDRYTGAVEEGPEMRLTSEGVWEPVEGG